MLRAEQPEHIAYLHGSQHNGRNAQITPHVIANYYPSDMPQARTESSHWSAR